MVQLAVGGLPVPIRSRGMVMFVSLNKRPGEGCGGALGIRHGHDQAHEFESLVKLRHNYRPHHRHKASHCRYIEELARASV